MALHLKKVALVSGPREGLATDLHVGIGGAVLVMVVCHLLVAHKCCVRNY